MSAVSGTYCYSQWLNSSKPNPCYCGIYIQNMTRDMINKISKLYSMLGLGSANSILGQICPITCFLNKDLLEHNNVLLLTYFLWWLCGLIVV
jgi:hypothetical protein